MNKRSKQLIDALLRRKPARPRQQHPVFSTLRVISLFFPGLLFLTLYFVLIATNSIGRDLLMQAGEYPEPALATFLALLSWMFFNWRSSRRVSDKYQQVYPGENNLLFRHLPRWMSYQAAVLLQIGILLLPTIRFSCMPVWMILYWLAGNVLYIALHVYFKSHASWARNTSWALCIMFLALFGVILHQAPADALKKNAYNLHMVTLPVMAILSFALQVAFIRFALYWHRVTAADDTPEKKMRRFLQFNLVAIIPLTGFLMMVLLPAAANWAGPLSCTLIGISLWVGFICLMQFIGLHFRFDTVFLLIPLAIFWGMITINRYDVDMEIRQADSKKTYRTNLNDYLQRWLTHPQRQELISKSDSSRPFPVYLVIADGGASKSGYWVSSVLAKMEAETASDPFSNHLLSLAGASGGSVGNAAFYSLLKSGTSDKPASFETETKNFFKSDLLTYSLARFLGVDLFNNFIPWFCFDDRATALATAMEKLPKGTVIGDRFAKPVEEILDSTGRLPLLFINTTHLQAGHPCLISSVKYDNSFSARWDVLDILNKEDSNSTIKFSTAVVLGARFPYISPAGGIGKHFFVDGGYYDNSGAGVTLELLEYLQRKMADTSSFLNAYRNRLQFKVIYLSNGRSASYSEVPDLSKKGKLNPLANDLAAPILTVLGTYSNQTGLSNLRLEKYMQRLENKWGKNGYTNINLPLTGAGEEDEFPMNWVISDYYLHRIQENVQRISVLDSLRN